MSAVYQDTGAAFSVSPDNSADQLLDWFWKEKINGQIRLRTMSLTFHQLVLDIVTFLIEVTDVARWF